MTSRDSPGPRSAAYVLAALLFGRSLFRGFSLDIRGNAARVKNQIYIPREQIPDEDVLLERRQLGTNFEYSFDIGFSYTFGSMFNNVVNPRMSRGGRGGDRYH